MKKFINKLLIFSLFPILYFGLNEVVNYGIYSNNTCKIKESNVLIIGDSHPQTSLNPKLFRSATNVSQTAEPYIMTYWKLKNILKTYHPDTVIIGCAPHNFSAFNDLKFSDRNWSSEMFKRIYPIQEFKSLSSIDIDYMEFYRVLWKKTGFYPKFNHGDYIGGYANRHDLMILDVNTAIDRHYYNHGEELGVSEIAISYLDSLVNICITHGINPILVSNPVLENYYEKIPPVNKAAFEEVKARLISEGVTVIDKTTEYYADTLFINADHLNERGATIFTSDIIEITGTASM